MCMHDAVAWGRDAALCLYLKIQQNGDSVLTGVLEVSPSYF